MKLALNCAISRSLPAIAFGLSSLLLSQFTLAQATVPGTIQAENFISDPYTNAVVGKEDTRDTGLGQNVGWIDANDWMRYSINVTTAGQYKVTYRVASYGGGKVVLTQNHKDLSRVIDVPYTGGWQNWDYAYTSVYLNAGVQEIMVYAVAGGFNLNWFQLTPENTNTGPTKLNVWPVGDSITAGVSIDQRWDPINGGYRRNLMMLLNDGYKYDFKGNEKWPNLGTLPNNNSGYGGEGAAVFTKSEFSPENIRTNDPDAVLLLLGINSIGHRKEYPDAQGQYWSVNGHRFNSFFNKYHDFIDKMLANSKAKVFIAKLLPIGDTRFYQQQQYPWLETPNPWGWTTVGDGSINPKNVVPEFNTELQALYDTYYRNNPNVVLVDMNTGFTVGNRWENDVTIIGPFNEWWWGDGLHPTPNGYRHIAEKWNEAIRKNIPTSAQLLYSVDCGTKEGVVGMPTEGVIKGSNQSAVSDRKYGQDPQTGKWWGRDGTASYNNSITSGSTIWFGWEGTNTVYESVATAKELSYRFEVPAGGHYRVLLGFHDAWAEAQLPQIPRGKVYSAGMPPDLTGRRAEVRIDGALKETKEYRYFDFGRSMFDVTNTTGTLVVNVKGLDNNDALLDSIVIQRIP